MNKNFLQALSLTVALIGMGQAASAVVTPELSVSSTCCKIVADCKYGAKQGYDKCHHVDRLDEDSCKSMYNTVMTTCENQAKSCPGGGCGVGENKEK